ncbi:MAG: LrgB family protein [Tissierellia bacterium]|nr:LrgB family protein [Tissierellia bacterium]
MTNLIKSPFFGILLSIIMYLIGLWVAKKIKSPITNPLLIAMVLVIATLKVFKISFEDFNNGGKYITFLIAPATVAMIINLYKNINLLKKNLVPIIVGVVAGVVTSALSVYLMSKLFGLNEIIRMSIIPKSLTTAIGVALSSEYGGIPPITVVCMVITGIGGAVVAPLVMKVLKVEDPVAQGVGIGTTSHAVGTSRALQMGEVQGAMSGLSIALAGFVSVILIPIIIRILT